MLEIEQISFGHLQWIYYRQALDGYDSQGNFVQIQHAFFRGEIDFQGLKPDGYLFKDGKHYFYEYQGKTKFLNESSFYIKVVTGTVAHVFHLTSAASISCHDRLSFVRKLKLFVNMAKCLS